MNAFTSGDLLLKHNLNKQKQDCQSLVCEICYNYDEFSLCGECLNKFNSKILRFKANTKKDNFELNNALKDYIEKRKNEIEKFNKISARKSNINNLNKLVSLSKSRIKKNKANSENLKTQKQSIENKIKNFEENILTLNNSIISFKKSNANIGEIMQKKNSEKNICIKNFFKKILKLIFCGNKIYLFAEIFEKDEYVLPSLDKAAGSRKKFFDDFSNILSTEVKSFENFSIEDPKKPHLFEKYLKTKDSVINYNMNPYPFSNEKDLKQQEKDFFNKLYVYEINNYVHKLILLAKFSAKFLNIKLPCDIESENHMQISDNFDFSCEIKKLLIPDNYANFNETATFAALLTLDKNLNFIKDYLGIKIKKSGLLSNYFNASKYNDKNNFEILSNNNINNNVQNNLMNLNKRLIDNYYQNDSRLRNNSVSVNLATKGNLDNSQSLSFNNVNKPNIATCNNMEFNADFLNISPFFTFCGESFEVLKFSNNCELIKKQNNNSNRNLNKLINNNNESNNSNIQQEYKNDRKNLNEKTYEILNERGIDYKDANENNNKIINSHDNQDDFVFEDIGITEGIINGIKKDLPGKRKNEEDHSGFVIIDDYFADKKRSSIN
jgi:hypothetical protein